MKLLPKIFPAFHDPTKWHHLLALTVLGAVSLTGFSYALNTVSTGHKTTNVAQTIDHYATCTTVRHTGSSAYFIPTKTENEWNQFVANKPGDVGIEAGEEAYLDWRSGLSTDDNPVKCTGYKLQGGGELAELGQATCTEFCNEIGAFCCAKYNIDNRTGGGPGSSGSGGMSGTYCDGYTGGLAPTESPALPPTFHDSAEKCVNLCGPPSSISPNNNPNACKNGLSPVLLAPGLYKCGNTKCIWNISGGNSDVRLKENIRFYGFENGHRTYTFEYKALPGRVFVGVMAQELLSTYPEAVKIDEKGYFYVDYQLIGVNFREVLIK